MQVSRQSRRSLQPGELSAAYMKTYMPRYNAYRAVVVSCCQTQRRSRGDAQCLKNHPNGLLLSTKREKETVGRFLAILTFFVLKSGGLLLPYFASLCNFRSQGTSNHFCTSKYFLLDKPATCSNERNEAVQKRHLTNQRLRKNQHKNTGYYIQNGEGDCDDL